MSAAEIAGLVALGLAVGTFGTIVGAGGGFVLVPILLLLYPRRDPATITAISLLVTFANAASGSLAYAWQRRVDLFSGAWFALAALPGAVVGALVVDHLPRRAFEAIFAALLLAMGVYLNLPRTHQRIREPLRGRGVVSRALRDREGHTYVYRYRLWQGMLLSAGIGFLSSLLGIGGGIVHVPVMAVVLRFPVHVAAATSQFVLALTTFEGSAVHVAAGHLGWNDTLARAAAIAAGAVPGAQVGARLAPHVAGPTIIRALGVALVVVALRLALAAAT